MSQGPTHSPPVPSPLGDALLDMLRASSTRIAKPGTTLISQRHGSSEHYTVHEAVLGNTSFAHVYDGARVSGQVPVAIKVATEYGRATNDLDMEQIIMELLMVGGGHENILRLLDVVAEETTGKLSKTLILPRCNMTLVEWFAPPDVKPTGALVDITRQLYSGLAHIHNNGILHKDLSLKNVLLCRAEGCVKICDFGMSATVADDEDAPHKLRVELHSFTSFEILKMWLARSFACQPHAAYDEFRTRGVPQQDAANGLRMAYDHGMNMVSDKTFYNKQNWEEVLSDKPRIRTLAEQIIAWDLSQFVGALRGRAVPRKFVEAFMPALLLGPIQHLTADYVSQSFDQLVRTEVRNAAKIYLKSGAHSPVLDDF